MTITKTHIVSHSNFLFRSSLSFTVLGSSLFRFSVGNFGWIKDDMLDNLSFPVLFICRLKCPLAIGGISLTESLVHYPVFLVSDGSHCITFTAYELLTAVCTNNNDPPLSWQRICYWSRTATHEVCKDCFTLSGRRTDSVTGWYTQRCPRCVCEAAMCKHKFHSL